MKRATLSLVATMMVGAVACTNSLTAPAEEPDCAPPGPEADWCHHLDNDVVRDTLLTYPDSINPATGLPWDTTH